MMYGQMPLPTKNLGFFHHPCPTLMYILYAEGFLQFCIIFLGQKSKFRTGKIDETPEKRNKFGDNADDDCCCIFRL